MCSIYPCNRRAVDRGRCEQHALPPRKPGREENRQPEPRARAKAIYDSARWKALRAHTLGGEPFCRRCRRRAATNVHHITDLNRGGDPWDPDNLEPLCASCHSRHTLGERNRERGL